MSVTSRIKVLKSFFFLLFQFVWTSGFVEKRKVVLTVVLNGSWNFFFLSKNISSFATDPSLNATSVTGAAGQLWNSGEEFRFCEIAFFYLYFLPRFLHLSSLVQPFESPALSAWVVDVEKLLIKLSLKTSTLVPFQSKMFSKMSVGP